MQDVIVIGQPTLELEAVLRVLAGDSEIEVRRVIALTKGLPKPEEVDEEVILVLVISSSLSLPQWIGHLEVWASRGTLLVLAEPTDRQSVIQVLNAGAVGYVTLQTGGQYLIEAIRHLGSERPYVCPRSRNAEIERALEALPKRQLPPHEQLTTREYEVLEELRRGLELRDIADRLFISVRTVQQHVGSASRKLGLKTRYELLNYLLSGKLGHPEQ